MKREVPLFLTILFGCFMVLKFFIPHPYVERLGSNFEQWTVIVTAAAVVLGVANVARLHVTKIQRREKDHFYSFPLLIGLTVMIALGVAPEFLFTRMGMPGGTNEGSPFDYLYQFAYVPMQGTMFSLLAFYIASAAFRAFRIRKLEAALLAITAVFVMIGRVPIGAAISDWWQIYDKPALVAIQEWIMDVPNNGAKRAILIGAALGAIATSLKIILGIERSAIGGE